MISFIAFSVVLLAVILILLKRKRGQKYPQQTRLKALKVSSSGVADTSPFHGVRVVDFSTVVAGPIAARTFADLGAEVIKVETPGGDPFRKTFREYEPGRTIGTTFEMCNLGKSSVVLDCKKASGRKEFLKLLKGADVLITNVRCDALKRLKLDYESVRLEMPHLVYCSLTAYGSEGPDANAPGYDVGAFWAATGMAASIQPQPLHGVYPAAFGDTTTGSALVGGAACALRRRCLTGQGCLVDASLLGAGLFCLSATVCQQVPDRRPTTEAAVTAVAASAAAGGLGSSASPSSSCVAEEPDVSRHFACKDGAVAVLGPRLTHAPPRQHGGGSRDGRGGSGDGVGGPSVADLERALKINHNSARGTESPLSSLSHAFATLTVASAVDLLTAANVPCCRASELLHFKDFVSDHGDELFHPTADCVPEFEADVALLPRKPFVFLKQGTEEEHGHDTSGNNNTDGNNKSVWCEEGQRPRASAPALGAHTKDVLKNGWQPRHPSCVFPTQPREAAALLANASSTSTSTTTVAAAAAAADAASSRLGLLLLPSATRPLEGLVVVELSWGAGVAASATAMLLREAGATVLKVVTTSTSITSSSSDGGGGVVKEWARLQEQYDQGKDEVVVSSLDGNEDDDDDDDNGGGNSIGGSISLKALLASRGAACLITDAPASVLRRAGVLLAPSSSSSSSSPSPSSSSLDQVEEVAILKGVVVAVVSPWGLGGAEGPRGDLGPFWSRSGMGATVSGQIGLQGTANVAPLPLFMGELITAVHSFSAVTAALLRRQRCALAPAAVATFGASGGGESGGSGSGSGSGCEEEAGGGGLLVDISMERSGTWCTGCIATWLAADPHKARLWDVPPANIPIRFPIPTMTALTTKDGVSVQLLGLDFPKHLLPTLRAFGAARPTVFAHLAKALVTEVLPSKAPSRILKLVPLLIVANGYILAGAKALTYAECVKRFEEHGVWFTVVRSPAQAAAYEQAEAAGCFRKEAKSEGSGGGGHDKRRLIASPIHFG